MARKLDELKLPVEPTLRVLDGLILKELFLKQTKANLNLLELILKYKFDLEVRETVLNEERRMRQEF